MSLLVNLHIIVGLDHNGALAATKASAAASEAAANDGGSRPNTILIPSGGRGVSGTGRGNYGRGTVGDAYISTFIKVSSENNFTLTSLDICAQGKIEGKIDAKAFSMI